MSKEQTAVFISGNNDLTEKQFIQYYLPILKMMIDDENTVFRISDDTECSNLCIKTFEQFLKNKKRVIIYSTSKLPPKDLPSGYGFIGGFLTMEERDAAMTITSDTDLHIVLQGEGKSSVTKNILRRYTPEYNYAKFIATGQKEFWQVIFSDISENNVQSK